MVKNGNSRELDGIFARHDEVLDATQEQLLEEVVALRVQLALAELKQAALRRSKMSALEKSRFIRARGKPEYDRLPW
jgi:hypothetical protein